MVVKVIVFSSMTVLSSPIDELIEHDVHTVVLSSVAFVSTDDTEVLPLAD